MNVEIQGVLRFKHRAGLEKGLTAFDDNAYPEFFKSELWSLSGQYAHCKRKFEIEPDCDYSAAFLAMAREAVEGVIYLREGAKAKQFIRITKIGKPVNRWIKLDDDARTHKFGREAADLETKWATAIQEAGTVATAKAADEAKREARKQAKSNVRVNVVDLPSNPSHVIALADGALAVAAGSKVCFVAPTGELLGTTECGLKDYDQFGLGMTGLVGLGDGRVVAVQELAYDARLVDRRQAHATAITGDDKHGMIRGGTAAGNAVVLRALHAAYVLGADGAVTQTLSPWADDFLDEVAPWRGGTLLSASSKTVWFDAAGEERFTVIGRLAMTLADTFLAFDDNERMLAIIDAHGKVLRTINTGDVGHGSAEHGFEKSWARRGDRFIAATRWPSSVREHDLATGKLVWRHDNIIKTMPGGLCVTDALAATWSPPPYIRDKDTTIFVNAGDREVARLDAKAPVIGMTAIGDTTLAAFVEGRTAGSKIYVWRDAATSPKLETLAGHKGRVRGVLALGDRLVSWAADRTLRIWQL